MTLEDETDRRDFFYKLGALGLAGLGAGTLVRAVFNKADPWDNFEHYPFADRIDFQSDYGGRIKNLSACSFQLEKRAEQYQQVADLFACPLTVYTDQPHPLSGDINQARISFVEWSWIRDLITFSGKDLLIRPSWDNPTGASAPKSVSTRSRRQKIARSRQERELLEKIASREGLGKKVAPIYHEGGCVLKTNQHTILSNEYMISHRFHPKFIEEHASPAQKRLYSQGRWQELYESLVGPTVVIPMTYQRRGKLSIAFTGHIDTVVSPANDQTILVGDMKEGQRMVEGLTEQERKEWQERARSHIVHPRLKEATLALVGKNNTSRYFASNRDLLNQIASTLSEHYQVKRLPMPLVGFFQGSSSLVTFPLIYTNGLLEHSTGKAAVPEYGLESIDKKIAGIYQSCGYSNFLGVDSMMSLFTFSGLRCHYAERRS